MIGEKQACMIHGTWVCGRCGWKRQGANRLYEGHQCSQCGAMTGKMLPRYHHNPYRTKECAEVFAAEQHYELLKGVLA